VPFLSARHLGLFLHDDYFVDIFALVFVLARVNGLVHHPEVIPAVPELGRQIVEFVEGNPPVRVQKPSFLEEVHVGAVALVVRNEGPGPDI